MSKRISKAGPIVVFIPFLACGGAERMVLEIARLMVQKGIEVDLVVTRSGGELWNSIPEGIRLVNLRSWKKQTCLFKMFRYLKHRKPAVLISTIVSGNVVSLFIKKYFIPNLKLIVRQENIHSMEYKYSKYGMRVQMRIMERLLPVADAIIAVSKGSAEDLKSSIPRAANLVTYVPNPVVYPALFEMARVPLEHPWLSDSKIPVIITCGRLDIVPKDQPTLLKAFAEIRRSRSARLVIIGEGPDKSKLMNLAQDLGIQKDVNFVGFQSNPFSYIFRSQVFVLSSIHEGLSLAIIEALACGTPVVSTDCPHGPREILENGELGSLVPVGDWKAMAQAITETLDHPPDPKRLVARALEYSSTASINQHFDLLRLIDPCILDYDN